VLGGFAVSLATAILPLLSRQAIAENRGPFKDSLAFALRLLVFVTIPASVGLIVLRTPIVRVLFEGGRFVASDTAATARALAALAVGLLFFAGVRIVVPAFYALKDTRMPVLAAFADCATFILLCVLLTGPLGLPGIGLAASGAAAVNLTILLAVLRRREGRLRGRQIALSLVRVAAAAAVMGAALEAAMRLFPLEEARGWKGAVAVMAVVLVGAALYWAAAILLRAPEPAELRSVARRRK
jgi:putative peptidoglycan lipid II flippase